MNHLSTPAGMSRWCLGMFETRQLEPGLLAGRSLFSGTMVYSRLVRDEAQLRVDYWVGSSLESLVPWIHSQVKPGAALGYDVNHCLVVLSACRPKTMPDASWQRVMRTHDTEIDLIAAQIEADEAAGQP